MNLDTQDAGPVTDEPPPKVAMAREKLLEEATKALEGMEQKKSVSLVVIGMV